MTDAAAIVAALPIFSRFTCFVEEADSWVVGAGVVGATKAGVEVAERRAMRVVSLYMLENIRSTDD